MFETQQNVFTFYYVTAPVQRHIVIDAGYCCDSVIDAGYCCAQCYNLICDGKKM
jgi:hypothetical protein